MAEAEAEESEEEDEEKALKESVKRTAENSGQEAAPANQTAKVMQNS